MKYNPQKHHRQSIRLQNYDYTRVGAYFVTIVTQGRECLFGEIIQSQMNLSARGKIAEECWQAIPEHFPFVELGAYVVMPNHVHGIIVIAEMTHPHTKSMSNPGHWGPSFGHINRR